MNYLALIPLAATIINIVIISYVTATGMRTRASRAFGMFIVAVLAGEIADFILWSYPSPVVAITASRLGLPFRLALGFLYCNLIMVLMEQRRGVAYYLLMAVSVAAAMTALPTELFHHYEPIALSYGMGFHRGILHKPIIIATQFLPVCYAIFLLAGPREHARADTGALTGRQRVLLLCFSLLVLISGILLAIVLPGQLPLEDIPPVVSSVTAVIVIGLYTFIVKFRLFSDHIHGVAYELFSRINDCIIIFDRHRKIIEINRPARELLGLVSRPIAGLTADDIFPAGYSFTEEYSGREIELGALGRPRHILVTQTNVVAGEPDSGRLVILKDVTDRRAAEKALVVSEAEYRATVDSLDSYLCVVDRELRVVLINRAMTALVVELGIDPRTVVGGLLFPALPFLDEGELRRRIREVMESGNPLITEERRVIAGRELVAETRLVPVMEDETVTRVTMTITDITRRTKIEEALRVSEDKFFKAFNASPIAMAINSLSDGRYLDVNETQVDQSGYRRDEFIGRTIFDLGIFADREEFTRFSSLLTEHRKVRNLPCRMRIKSGEVLDGVLSADIIQIFDVDYVISATVNISDLKRAEKKILEQYGEIQEQYRVLEVMNEELSRAHDDVLAMNHNLAREKERLAITLRAIGEGVITLDAAGRIELMNTLAGTITGWDAAAAAGRPIEAVLPIINERSGLTCREMVDTVLDTGRIIEMRFNTSLTTPAGEKKYISAIGSPIRDQGTIDGAILAFRDVTDRKRMEEELFKTSKIESLGIFAGGIAHDFNNLLTSIMGNASLGRLMVDNPDRLREILREIELASERARELTMQLLTFSKGGAPIRQTTSIRDLLRDTARFVLSGSAIRVSYDLPETLWDAEVDAGQISQVIQNLILNACDAMPGRGTLVVTAVNRVIGAADGLPLADGNYLHITVRDDGHGIDEETLRSIFDPFFTTKVNGTGLGLSVVYSIVKRHDGHIAVSSRRDAGTTFDIFLPATGATAPRAVPGTGEIPTGTGRILLMDDEQLILDVGGRMISRLGYRVDTAVTGEAAIAQYRLARDTGDPYDALIMDLTIRGGMGGREAIALLQNDDPGVVAIVSSGYSNDPVMADFRRYGFTDVVTKPYRFEDLAAVLHRVLTGDGKKSATRLL